MATTAPLERIYKLTVDGTQAEKSLRGIATTSENLDKQFKNLTDGVKKFTAGIALIAVAREALQFFTNLTDAMDEAVKASQKLGLSIQAFQEWSFALKLSGVDSGTFATAVGKVAQGIADIDTGKITDATTAMKAFGVTGRDTAESALDKLVTGFASLEDGPKKTALALEIFGKSGKDLIPLLNSGAAGIEAFRKELALLGGTFTDEDARRAEEFNDNLERVATAARAAGRGIVEHFLPELVAVSGALVENIKQLGFWRGLAVTAFQSAMGTAGTAEQQMQRLVAERNRIASNTNLIAVERGRSLDREIAQLKIAVDVERALKGEIDEAARLAKVDAAARLEAGVKEQKAIDEKKKAIEEAAKAEAKARKTQTDNVATNQQKMEADGNAFIAESVKKLNDVQKESIDIAREELQVKNETLVFNDAYTKSVLTMEEAVKAHTLAVEEEARQTAILYDWLTTGTEAQMKYAKATLEAREALNAQKVVTEKVTTETEILSEGMEQFFTNLSSGVADFEDLLKRTVQSIIAELLKIWAKKYIIDAIMGMFGPAPVSSYGSGGVPFPIGFSSQAVATSSSGTPQVGLRATPMDAAQTATSSMISPLPRGQSGGANVQVNVHNNAAGAQVDVQTSDDGTRIDIIIERTKRALASDVRTGGSMFSGALEATYALGRARA